MSGYGEADLQSNVENHVKNCPECRTIIESVTSGDKRIVKDAVKKGKANFDLNGDGKVDKKDRSLAARFLGSRKGKEKKK